MVIPRTLFWPIRPGGSSRERAQLISVRRAPARNGRHPEAPAAPDQARSTPPIDIYEGPEGLILEADLPGATAASLVVEVADNVLSISAQVATADYAPRPIHAEYRPGLFERSFILSDEVDRTRISATLVDGVLRLTLPKAERSQPRRIDIRTPSRDSVPGN